MPWSIGTGGSLSAFPMWLLEDRLISNWQSLKGKYLIILIWINIYNQKSEFSWCKKMSILKKDFSEVSLFLIYNLNLCLCTICVCPITDPRQVRRECGFSSQCPSLLFRNSSTLPVTQMGNADSSPLPTPTPWCFHRSYFKRLCWFSNTPLNTLVTTTFLSLPASFIHRGGQRTALCQGLCCMLGNMREWERAIPADLGPTADQGVQTQKKKGREQGSKGGQQNQDLNPMKRELAAHYWIRDLPQGLVTAINLSKISFLLSQASSNLIIYPLYFSSWMAFLLWIETFPGLETQDQKAEPPTSWTQVTFEPPSHCSHPCSPGSSGSKANKLGINYSTMHISLHTGSFAPQSLHSMKEYTTNEWAHFKNSKAKKQS